MPDPKTYDWAARYREKSTPWDLGRAHPELGARLAAGELDPPGRVLVPGCGRGHDARAFAERGFAVTALDLTDLGATEAGLADALASRGGSFRVEDALLHDPDEPYDLVFEHTFYCALPPEQRGAWGELVRRVLAPGGRLVAVAFPLDRPAEMGGPPHGYRPDDLLASLGAGFRVRVDEALDPARVGRRWEERWMVIERPPA